MKKILDIIAKIKKDKLLHFICGAAAAQAVFSVLFFTSLPAWTVVTLTFISSVLVGGAKELLDIKFGTPSWGDFLATVLGGLAGTIVVTIVEIFG